MNLFFGHYSTGNDDMAIAPKAGDGKLYKIVRAASMAVVILAIILVVLEAFQIFNLGTTGNGLVCTIGVIGIGGLVALPWVRVFEAFKEKRYKIIGIVFLALIGVCVILWIVCVWMIIGLVEKASAGDGDKVVEGVLDSLNVIRIAIIISLQFMVASYIAKNIIKYNKTLLVWQIIAGVALLYIDIYLILILTAVTITAKGDVIVSEASIFLTKMIVHALFAIAVIISIFPNVVFRRTDRRNLLEARNNSGNGNNAKPSEASESDNDSVTDKAENKTESADEKLLKIKELLDKGLITQEEYDKKREDILSNL